MRLVGGCGSRDEFCLPLTEIPLAIEPPGLRIEHEQARWRGRACATGRTDRAGSNGARAGARQREAAGPRHDHLVVAHFRDDIVGARLDDYAVGRHQRVEFDELLRLEETACRSERRHHEQRVANFGVGEAMKLRGRVERDGSARPPAALRDANDAERLRRLEHHVADDNRPGQPLGADAGQLGFVELELDHLSAARSRDRRVADAAPGLRGDLVDVDRRLAVEHQPDRVGAAEHRGRRRHDKREGQAQRLALAAHVDHDRRCGIGYQRLCVLRLARRDGGGRVGRLRQRHALRPWLRSDGTRRQCGGLVGSGRGSFGRFDRRSLRFLRRARRRLRGRGAMFAQRGSEGGRLGFLQLGHSFAAWRDRHDIDDVIVVLAERADIDLADEVETHRDGIAACARLDRRDRRRQRRLRIGEIELERRFEREGHPVIDASGRDCDQCG